MRVGALFVGAVAAVAGFVVARVLLDREAAAPPLPDSLERARALLLEARDRAVEAIDEAHAAREQATSELTQDYIQRIRRQPPD